MYISRQRYAESGAGPAGGDHLTFLLILYFTIVYGDLSTVLLAGFLRHLPTAFLRLSGGAGAARRQKKGGPPQPAEKGRNRKNPAYRQSEEAFQLLLCLSNCRIPHHFPEPPQTLSGHGCVLLFVEKAPSALHRTGPGRRPNTLHRFDPYASKCVFQKEHQGHGAAGGNRRLNHPGKPVGPRCLGKSGSLFRLLCHIYIFHHQISEIIQQMHGA